MLVPNANIWDTRIQTVGALVTVVADGRSEVYYLATACQVGIDPPMISISPNPEYPICAAIALSGRFGVNYLAEGQEALVHACIALDRSEPDKLSALALEHEVTDAGTPLLLHCLQALECVVVSARDVGDHRTVIGQLSERRIRPLARRSRSQRYFPRKPRAKRILKGLLVRTRLYDALLVARRVLRPPPDVAEGTRTAVAHPTTGDAETQGRRP